MGNGKQDDELAAALRRSADENGRTIAAQIQPFIKEGLECEKLGIRNPSGIFNRYLRLFKAQPEPKLKARQSKPPKSSGRPLLRLIK